eukprot:8049410-Lingulodinium_polyedra.AAC.1
MSWPALAASGTSPAPWPIARPTRWPMPAPRAPEPKPRMLSSPLYAGRCCGSGPSPRGAPPALNPIAPTPY